MRAPAAAAFALLAASCKPLPPAEDDGLSLDARGRALAAIDEWRLQGRIAIDTGTEAFQGRVTWVQRGESLLLSVRGPLNVGSIEIAGTPPALTVRGRGERFELEDAEPQLSGWLGWWLPVTSLPSWLQGRPDAGFPVATAARRRSVLETIEQRGWSIRYGPYTLADGLLVPREIVFTHEQLEIRLRADDWQLAADAAST